MAAPRHSRADLRQLRLRAVGARVRQHRQGQPEKVYQREAAARAGISRAEWSRVENGNAPGVTLAMLYDIADAIGVHITDLLEDREHPPSDR